MPNAELPQEHHIATTRTARYFTLGGGPDGEREVWFALHGYGQLASLFLGEFEPLARPDRLIVAPEGLSRFYLDPVTSGPAARRKVGASWMTREDRVTEIDDYVRYLDAVYESVGRRDARVTVVGFSQGTAAACRWLARGAARVDRLILWEGELPPDLDLAAARDRFATLDLTLVYGREDTLITAKIGARDRARLEAERVPFRTVEFGGGHAIDQKTLRDVMREA